MNKIIGVGPHYNSALRSRDATLQDPLYIFIKPMSSFIFTGETIIIPKNINKVVAEVEVAILIGKTVRNISVADAAEGIITGFALSADITALDVGVIGEGKVYDTFTPLGYFHVLSESVAIEMRSYQNEHKRQYSTTLEMGYSFEQLISYISSYFTITEGDIILTGTPAGTFQIFEGDTIKFISPQLGTLTHQVLKEGLE